MSSFAKALAEFLIALQFTDSTGEPLPGSYSFYRGGSLLTYDAATRQAITALKDQTDAQATIEVWETALATTWQSTPAGVHRDISASNLLVQKGQLKAVTDFDQLAVGGPVCDLAIAWPLFSSES